MFGFKVFQLRDHTAFYAMLLLFSKFTFTIIIETKQLCDPTELIELLWNHNQLDIYKQL